MNIILFDSFTRMHLLPLTFTRPVAELRAGITTVFEKWQRWFPNSVSCLAPDYIKPVFPVTVSADNILIDGSIIPDQQMVSAILQLKENSVLTDADNNILAARLSESQVQGLLLFSEYLDLSQLRPQSIETIRTHTAITNPWDLFSMAGDLLKDDFLFLTKDRKSAPLHASNRYVNPENIFIEEGAVVEFSILNASSGPIYIGKDTEVMENCVIRGPFALGEHSTLKMSSKIYGPTIIGPHCKVGGEVNNSVFLGYSNKAHDGFLGNSVIGEWCNLGADTNNSNLKNTYEEVKLWSYVKKGFASTGLQFCGLIMGDHTKCSINTMFNTGTVTGVSCNLYGDGFHRNFVPSFSWGSTAKLTDFQFEKAMVVAERVMARRGLQLTDSVRNMLNHIFSHTEEWHNK
ncbi:MAG: glucose-1-phosphate thymidylyltransferase [Bacteroidetes bacterium GWF2_43_63]|nr:MAG: glucose-1-phosphate thymidylyltransferase [Bacteroidetes bacterium GWE2_42_42]OFY53689.1 MAG: glucose-1-phosphate thymidylyltransferase [Bacteroidetes bacterium GWF2_43_63]HBG70965.1 glucose-1-phosphate thymidylyltransferase [Bacteroidales bacterium]HCB62944.1 glucose-1-phosphate thymidylyltransferase [Bacteroidales bacterium]HCY24292.1 glucose-1-phosphate thymidylyltransferase [Bacteroidales bacterium]